MNLYRYTVNVEAPSKEAAESLIATRNVGPECYTFVLDVPETQAAWEKSITQGQFYYILQGEWPSPYLEVRADSQEEAIEKGRCSAFMYWREDNGVDDVSIFDSDDPDADCSSEDRV